MVDLFIRHPDFAPPGFAYGFGSRAGDMAAPPPFEDDILHTSIRAYRKAILLAGRGSIENVCWANQVHGTNVHYVGDPDEPCEHIDADAVVTDLPGVAVAVRTADCLPILLFGTQPPVVAAVHAGWRGTINSALAYTLTFLNARWGIEPAMLHMVMGPCIGPEVYEVSDELAERFEQAFGPAGIGRTGDNTPSLNLKEANRRIALNAGIPEAQIHTLPHCTHSEAEKFFSHRRDNGHTGRHLNFVAITDSAQARGQQEEIEL